MRLIGQIITWTITLIVIRLLSPNDYGLMALVYALVGLFTLLNEMGIGAGLIQSEEITEQAKRQAFGAVLVVSVAFYVILYFGAPVVAAIYEEPRLIALVRFMSLQLVIIGFTSIPMAMIVRHMNFRAKSIVDLCSNIVGALVTLYLAWSGYGVWSLAIGTLTTFVLRGIALNVISPVYFFPSFNWRGFSKLAAFGSLITADKILWFFYSRADIFIIGKALGTDMLGIYSVAVELASLPGGKINPILNEIAFPTFSRMQRHMDQVARSLITAIALLGLISFPVYLGIAAVAEDIVSIALGPKWLPTIDVLVLLCFIMPLRMISNLITTSLQGVGRPDISAINLLIACVIMPVAFLFGSQFGLIGVCFAWLIAFPVVFLIEVRNASKIIKLTYSDYFFANVRSMMISILMFVLVMGWHRFLPIQLDSVMRLSVSITLGIAIYGLLTYFFNRDILRKAVRLLRT